MIGEAASQVADETRALLPLIPWRVVVGMRHRLIHHYFVVDLDLVWNTATTHLDALVTAIRDSGILDAVDSESGSQDVE